MRLKVVAPPDLADGRLAEALALGHQPATPMRHPLGLGLQRRVDHGLHFLGSVGGLTTASRRDLPRTPQPLLGKTLSPQLDAMAIHLESGGNGQIGTALGGSQNHPAAECDLLRSSVGGQPLLKLFLLIAGKSQSTSRIRHDPL